MNKIKIRKGHSIRIAGIPSQEVMSINCNKLGLQPTDFHYIKPKLVVKEGEFVKTGSPLFFNKENPDQVWGAPGAGKVVKIQYGLRRIIEKIVIELDKAETGYSGKQYSIRDISNLNSSEVSTVISEANFWPLIRQRPFNRVVNPAEKPRDIFISAVDTAPLAPDIKLILHNQENVLQAGISVLSKLTDDKVHFCIPSGETLDIFNGLNNCVLHQVEGPHPAGNIGIQIHHIAPLKPNEIVWTVNIQHLLILGKLFLKGKIDNSIIIAVGGPGVKNPKHIKTRIGACIDQLVENNIKTGENRIISGDVLTGKRSEEENCLGFYDNAVSVLPIDKSRPFLGWVQPGSVNKTYSLTRSFLSSGNKLFNFSTKQNGSKRALVPINAWEDVLPMDILPNPLYRSILAHDVEEMEQLGILECDAEDFALCSFACPSKIDLSGVIRQGLDIMWAEK